MRAIRVIDSLGLFSRDKVPPAADQDAGEQHDSHRRQADTRGFRHLVWRKDLGSRSLNSDRETIPEFVARTLPGQSVEASSESDRAVGFPGPRELEREVSSSQIMDDLGYGPAAPPTAGIAVAGVPEAGLPSVA